MFSLNLTFTDRQPTLIWYAWPILNRAGGLWQETNHFIFRAPRARPELLSLNLARECAPIDIRSRGVALPEIFVVLLFFRYYGCHLDLHCICVQLVASCLLRN